MLVHEIKLGIPHFTDDKGQKSLNPKSCPIIYFPKILDKEYKSIEILGIGLRHVNRIGDDVMNLKSEF